MKNNLENFPKQEKETAYNLPEMAEIEQSMMSLCEKMKTELMSGEYDYIISDDKTGRVPSLIFKNILENLHPDKKINIFGISAGRKLTRLFEKAYTDESVGSQASAVLDKINSVLDKHVKPNVKNKALVVTEYIHSGGSMQNLKIILEKAGLPFDIATLNHFLTKELESESVKVFTSDYHVDSENPIFKLSEEYAGIETDEENLPLPVLYATVMKKRGRNFTIDQEKELSEAFQLTDEEKAEYYNEDEEGKKRIKANRDKRWEDLFYKYYSDSKDVLPGHLDALRKKIKETRADIKTIAKKIATELKS